MPLMPIDGDADDCAPTGDHGGFPIAAAAHRADRHRRMDKGLAILAALNAELPIGTRGPEPFGGRRQLGKRFHEFPAPRLAMIWGKSMVVRMPGAAAQTMGTAFTARLAV